MAENLKPVLEFSVNSSIRQMRMVPFNAGRQRALLCVHADCAEDDPFHKMFFLPSDTLKLSAFSLSTGGLIWQRDLGRGMIPGVWFCPVLPFDLDGDGLDEIWMVDNADADHPLNFEGFVLRRLDAATGEPVQSLPWPALWADCMSHRFRNFIQGATRLGQRRLITAQGTYAWMQLQCYDDQLKPLWKRTISPEEPGARGSHMFPVCDIDADGRDEIFWGERCIDIDTGRDIWVADRDGWGGHSDVVQPTMDRATGRWSLYTCRETLAPEGGAVMFDDHGQELWGHRGMGHVDMGWTARLNDDGSHLGYALQIGAKSAGPGGFKRAGVVENLYDMQGRPQPVKFQLLHSLPVDFNGDGRHELTYMDTEPVGLVVDGKGRELHQLTGMPRLAGKLLDLPGEQIATFDPSGLVRVYACPGASDSPDALARYQHPYYAACQRSTAMGYNLVNLGGL